MRLKDKVALVTGASRGIGRGIAEIFAEEGAHVAVNYTAHEKAAEDVAAWVRGKGRRAITVKADVAKRADVEAMVDEVVEGTRADRHSRQQRGHRDDRAVPRIDRRAVDAPDRRQPARQLAVLAGRLPPRRRGKAQGEHREHRFDSGRQGAAGPHALRADEARPRGAHAQHVGRDDAARHPRQLRAPGPHRDRT